MLLNKYNNISPHGYNNHEVILLNYKNKILIITLISLLLVGCRGKDHVNKLKEMDMAPKSFTELNRGIQNILDEVGQIEKIEMGIDSTEEKLDTEKYGEMNTDSEPQQSEESGQSQNQEEEGGGKEGENQSSPQPIKEKKDNKEEDKQKKVESIWNKIDKSLEEVHSSWNDYEVEGVRKGATDDKGVAFESSLNKMTKAVENRDILGIYDYGSQSIFNLKPYYDLYSDEIGGEVGKIKYMVYQYYISGILKNTVRAQSIISDYEENINKIRVKIDNDKNKTKELDKIIFGLKSLPQSLEEDSKRLLLIKKDVLIENLNALE